MNRKHFFNKDIFFSTVFVFLCVWLLQFSFVHLHALDPIEKALSDFDYSDLVYKYKKEKQATPTESDVVVVEMGRTRAEIARQIEIINQYQPAVLAVDGWFATPREADVDSLLIAAMAGSKNLVLGSYLQNDSNGHMVLNKSFAAISALGKNAYLNFVGEYEKTIRYFKPGEEVGGEEVNSFPAEIVKAYNPASYAVLKKRTYELENINYTKTSEQFVPTIYVDEVTPGNEALQVLKGKIVLLGKTNDNDLEDLHFTPFNSQLAGRSKPDMSGVFIHANIIEMVLHQNYINKVPQWIIYVIAVLLTYITIVFHIFYFVEKHIWYHLFAKILQLVFLIVIIFVKLQLLQKFSTVFDEKAIVVPVILSVDLLYFYDAIVKWMHKKFGYQSYFLNHAGH